MADDATGTRRAVIRPDLTPFNPRDNDNLTTLIYGHRRYVVGDRAPLPAEEIVLRAGGWSALVAWYRKKRTTVFVKKYGLLDHSGCFLYLDGGSHPSDPQGWDSGTVGIILVTKDALTRIGVDAKDAEAVARAEFAEYAGYTAGQVYEFSIWTERECVACGHRYVTDEETFGDFIGDPDPEKNGMLGCVVGDDKAVLIAAYETFMKGM